MSRNATGRTRVEPMDKEGRDTILVLFSSSWGEVDWVLPVLYELKALQPDWRIVAAFSSYGLLTRRANNRTLYAELNQVADDIVCPPLSAKAMVTKRLRRLLPESGPVRTLARRAAGLARSIRRLSSSSPQEAGGYDTSFLFPGVVRPEQVRVILKEHNPDNEFKLAVEGRCPLAKIVIYPAATVINISQEINRPKDLSWWHRNYIKHDLLLLGTQHDAVWWSERISDAKISLVGFPRYDQWWIKRLLKSTELLESQEAKRARAATRVFLFIATGPHRVYLPRDVFEYLVQSVAEVVLSDKRNFLLIRPHPRQDPSLLASQFDKFDSSRWMISSLQVMQLAFLSDFIISVWSSSILDALSVGKPVVEFFQYPRANEEVVICRDGRLGSPCRFLGLSVPADTKEELAGHIDSYFNDASSGSIWERQRQIFREWRHPDDRASRRAAKAILSLVEPDRTSDPGDVRHSASKEI